MTRYRIRVLAAVLAAGLIAISCGNSEGTSSSTPDSGPAGTVAGGGEATRNEFVAISGVPGVTDESITYDVIGTKANNPLGNCILDCYLDGVNAYFAYRNDQGGIYGRDLVIGDVLDDEVGQNQQKSLDVIAADDAFGVFTATLLPGGWGDLDEAGIPNYVWGIYAADSANRTHNFPSLVVRCPDCARPTVPYVAKSTGATKAASLGYGISESSKVCAESVADGFEKYQDQSGVELMYTNSDLPYGLSNGIGPEVSEMKADGVDFIATCMDLNAVKKLAQELSKQGMQDVVLYSVNSYDQAFIAEAGDLFNGDVVAAQFRPLEASPDGNALADFQTWMEKQGSTPTELAMVGWINASLAFDGLLAAGPNFDRASVTAATNSLTDWTAGGLVKSTDWTVAHDPYTADNPQYDPECTALLNVKGSTFVPFTSATEPWICWGDDAATNFEPTPTNFD